MKEIEEKNKILREIEENKVIAPFLIIRKLGKTFYESKGILNVLKEDTSVNYFSLLEKQIYFYFLKGVIKNVKKTEKQIEINFSA